MGRDLVLCALRAGCLGHVSALQMPFRIPEGLVINLTLPSRLPSGVDTDNLRAKGHLGKAPPEPPRMEAGKAAT